MITVLQNNEVNNVHWVQVQTTTHENAYIPLLRTFDIVLTIVQDIRNISVKIFIASLDLNLQIQIHKMVIYCNLSSSS